MSARARSTCWRSPSEITPKGRSPIGADPALGQQPVGPRPVLVRVGVHQVSSAPWRPLTTTSRAGRSARSWRVTEPLTSAMRGPQGADIDPARDGRPRTSTVPAVGHSRAPATCSSVVLPEPFGPRTTQRSPGRTASRCRRGRRLPRGARVTPCRAMTGSAVGRGVTRRGVDLPEAPVDAADQSRAALRPGPLAGQPEPELAPVPHHDGGEAPRAQAGRGQRAPAVPEPGGQRRRRRARTASRSRPVEDGGQPARRPGPSARRARAGWAARSRVNGG